MDGPAIVSGIWGKMKFLGSRGKALFVKPRVRGWALSLLLLLGVGADTPAGAQGIGLSVGVSAISATVNDAVTFTINVTNLTGVILQNVYVTNAFAGSAAVQFVNATNNWSGGTIFTNATSVLFGINQFGNGAATRMSVTMRPTTGGVFTNAVTFSTTTLTNSVATNVVVAVAYPAADLALTLAPPAAPIVVNDWVTYGLTVTNLGTNTVANVLVTNTGFAAMRLLSLSPANQAYTLTNGALVFNAGTLAGHAGRSFQVAVQPTNAGLLALSATVSATNISEVNLTNNTASTNLSLVAFDATPLIATNASAMTYDPQTGLMEQHVQLVNVGTNSVAAARVIVAGLTNQLYNAVGTNDGNPYVVYAASLDAGQSVGLVLEYFVPTRLPINVPDSAYTAVGVPAVDWSAPSVVAPDITVISNLGPAGILIEFAALTNRSYTIYYSADSTFTNAQAAQPSVVAPANRVQWIDDGPPKTVSHPTNVMSRFYRVRLNP